MSKKNHLHGVFSIPNLITYLRLALIPIFVVEYLAGRYVWALAILAVSGLSDVADGYIARHCDMVTDIGKIVDPLADKLTQAAVIFCAAMRNPAIWVLFGLLAVKEVTMGIFGLRAYRYTGAHSSKWYGKLCTVALYAAMVTFVLFPDLPTWGIWTITVVCAGLLLLSLLMYIRFFLRCVREEQGKAECIKGETSDEPAE